MADSRTSTGRTRLERVLIAAMVLGCIGLTAWVWSLPQALPAAKAWGERQAWSEVARRLGEERSEIVAAADDSALFGSDREAWRDENRSEFDRTAWEAAEAYRDRYSYRGGDGRDHVYLGDYDGYYWLHFARKLFRSGSLCDPGYADRCLDAQGHAPVGAPLAYPQSLHVFAIAAVHWLVDGVASPGYPLAASAMLVPVVVAVLGVLPAFFLGRQLGGNLGGMVSAVVIALHPLVLNRGLGGDNDVWNLVLPLYMVWTATAALSGGRLRRTVFAVLTGAVAGLHATIWQGWVFAYAVVAAGLLLYLAMQTIAAVLTDRSFHVWRHADVRANAETVVVLYVAAWLFTSAAGAGESYTTIPLKVLGTLAGPLQHSDPPPAVDALAWPHVLGTVGELLRPTLGTIGGALGGTGFLLASLAGLFIAHLPRGAWRIRHYVLLPAGIALYALDLSDQALNSSVALTLIAMPPVAAAALSLLERRRPTPTQGLAVILLLWFLGALYLINGGVRFAILLVPSFGLALGGLVGRIHERFLVLSAKWVPPHRTIGASVTFMMLAMILVPPVSKGIAAARDYVPVMNDAWWASLSRLRERSDPRSIVTVWWDYGHWAKYVADRRVTADGTSLLTHLPHWVGKAMTTPDPDESLGVLRMLDCGSDATPLPGGTRGAYGRIKAAGYDDLVAYSMVSALIVRDRAQAASHLTDRGLAGDARRDILAASHCDPPEAYLVLSTDMLRITGGLFSVGQADPRQKTLADRFQAMDEDEALTWLAAEFGYTRTEASSLYQKVTRQNRQASAEYVETAWRPCRSDGEAGVLECLLRSNEGSKLGLFRYRQGERPEATFEFESATAEDTNGRNGPPGLLLIAGNERLESVEFDAAPYPGMAVLVDPENARILVGTPAAVRSTLVQLLFLDGRYTKHFRKIDERGADPEERVSVWRIDWRQGAAGDEM